MTCLSTLWFRLHQERQLSHLDVAGYCLSNCGESLLTIPDQKFVLIAGGSGIFLPQCVCLKFSVLHLWDCPWQTCRLNPFFFVKGREGCVSVAVVPFCLHWFSARTASVSSVLYSCTLFCEIRLDQAVCLHPPVDRLVLWSLSPHRSTNPARWLMTKDHG